MICRQLLLLLALLAPALSAQERTSPLAELHEGYQQKRLRLARDGASFEAQQALTTQFVAELDAFLQRDAVGLDRFNGRLMLVDYNLSLGRRDEAVAALKALDAKAAPALILAGAAEFAAYLDLRDERDRWIEAALGKKESFENRMALATQLMTRLLEIDKGEQIFTEALAAAKTDQERARVAWYRALALREREDLSEDAYDQALQELAEGYPETSYGSIAADRRRARELKLGSAAIELSLTDSAGKPIRPGDYRGKVLVLDFWASWSGPCRDAAPRLAALQAKYGEQGLELLGINMDENRADFDQAVDQLGLTWRQVSDGAGPQTEAALRYAVDGPPRLLVIGRDGKIAALNLYPFDERATEELARVIEAALAGH